MANNNSPFGFLPLMTNLVGGNLALVRFPKLVGYATGIFQNDPVNRVSGGSVQASITPGTTACSGISLEYSPASTASPGICVVVGDSMIVEGQCAGSLVATQMGLNANMLAGAGSTLTRQSGYVIDDSTVATTATLDFHLLTAYGAIDNSYGAYARIEVVFNNSRLAGGKAGV